MQVAGIGRVGAAVELIETGEPRPLAGDEVLLEVTAAGVGNWDEFVRVGRWGVGARARQRSHRAGALTNRSPGRPSAGFGPWMCQGDDVDGSSPIEGEGGRS
jgi:hypothetical protein